MNFPRASGILLHPTSLPGPFGIGDLGPEAYRFVDFLVAAGQSLWQVLPLGPTGYGDSPYACYSAFAGNTLLISPEQLIAEGLLGLCDLCVSATSDAETQRRRESISAKRTNSKIRYCAKLTSVTRRPPTPLCAARSKPSPNSRRTGSKTTRCSAR